MAGLEEEVGSCVRRNVHRVSEEDRVFAKFINKYQPSTPLQPLSNGINIPIEKCLTDWSQKSKKYINLNSDTCGLRAVQ